MTTFFTADTHFGHGNIIKYSDRPFDCTHDMNVALCERWNLVVGRKDIVYHLGDVGFGSPHHLRSILDRLNGTIHLIEGNHDHRGALKPVCRGRFASISTRKRVVVQDQDAPRGRRIIILDHYSMRVWDQSYRGTWHLYGHSHGNLPDNPASRSFDIGVDCHNFTPLSYAQVKKIMEQKTWKRPFDPDVFVPNADEGL